MTRAGGSAEQRWRIVVAGAALIALLLCAVLGTYAPRQALLSYLAAWMFCLAPALGSLALLMVHALTGGAWGHCLRPQLLAATRLLPLLAVLLLPLLFSVHLLYPWAAAGAQDADPQLQLQSWYLDRGFFVVRAVVCFALWLWLARGMRKRLIDAQRESSVQRFAAFGLVIYALSASVAAVDWLMSLVPQWHSTVFGMIVITGQVLTAAALAVLCAVVSHPMATLPATTPHSDRARLPGDLGNLMLMLVLAWSYLAFMDYLTAWVGDLPAETVWYLPRLRTSWAWVGAALALFCLAVPFAVLLSRQAKRRAGWLGTVAGLLVAMHWIYMLWLVMPSFRQSGFALRWTDALALIGVGGLCLTIFAGELRAGRLMATLRVVEAMP
jgi:hypothetical protein